MRRTVRKRRKRKRIGEDKIFPIFLFSILAVWISLVMVKSITSYLETKKVYEQKRVVYLELMKRYESKKRELEVMEREYEKYWKNGKIRDHNFPQTEERASDTGKEDGG